MAPDLQINSDGRAPLAGLALAGGRLFGTTSAGGAAAQGTIFSLNTDGTGFTNLHDFPSVSGGYFVNAEGANPAASLLVSGNILYGMARGGGDFGRGTVFSIHTDGTGFATRYHFSGGANGIFNDGATPLGGLLLAGGSFYGTTAGGWGTVFSLSLPAEQPQLSFAVSGTDLVLTWPGLDFPGFSLQTTSDIESGLWRPVASVPEISGGQYQVRMPISGAQSFFRLVP